MLLTIKIISIQIQDVYDLFLFIIVLHEPVACLAISGTNGTYNKHDYFNQYVPASEHLEVTEDMLSPLNKFCMEKCTKLTPNLHDKHKYVIHYRTLQLYQELGVVLKKIHRVIEFNQRPWLNEYIDFNTKQRKMAKTPLRKNSSS